jgi:hypothetical protein
MAREAILLDIDLPGTHRASIKIRPYWRSVATTRPSH